MEAGGQAREAWTFLRQPAILTAACLGVANLVWLTAYWTALELSRHDEWLGLDTAAIGTFGGLVAFVAAGFLAPRKALALILSLPAAVFVAFKVHLDYLAAVREHGPDVEYWADLVFVAFGGLAIGATAIGLLLRLPFKAQKS